MKRSQWQMSKSRVEAENGLVVAEHPLAVDVGIRILKDGGNAIDASVAMAFALSVVMPGTTGIGGGGTLIASGPTATETLCVDFSMRAPKLAKPGCYVLADGRVSSRFGWRAVEDNRNMHGASAVAVPGFVEGLEAIHALLGTMSFSELLSPAIQLADRGVPLGWPTIVGIATKMPLLAASPDAKRIFLPGGVPPRPSTAAYGAAHALVQADLAALMRDVAQRGHDAIVDGPFSKSLDRFMERNDGLLRAEDLAKNPPIISDGQRTALSDFEVIGVPGPHGCFTVQQLLSMIDALKIEWDSPGASEIAKYVGAARLALSDRHAFGGDPEQSAVPFDGILSKAYAERRIQGISESAAPWPATPGNPWEFSGVEPPVRPSRVSSPAPKPGTSQFCAADSSGRLVTVTSTLVDSFGAGVVIPGTGALMNNAMQWLDPEEGSPNSIAPLRRGLNNQTPLVLEHDGMPSIALGASGGARILDAVSQLALSARHNPGDLQAAMDRPRIDCSEREIKADIRIPQDVLRKLQDWGHAVTAVEESPYGHHFARPAAIGLSPSGTLISGVDPFHPMCAGGF